MDEANLVSQESSAIELAPAQLQDIARVFRHIGVHLLRASVVDMSSKGFRATWSIDDFGEVSVGGGERPLDSAFLAGSATISQIAQTSGDETIVRRLSPRRWAFAWRIEGERAIVGEAQFHNPRDSVSEAVIAVIRLVCSTSIRGGGSASAAPREARAELVWPQVERRGPRNAPQSAWLPAALLGATALFASLLALVAVPDAREAAKARQVEIEQRRAMADGTMVHGLSLALASGDYGDVQSSLSAFSSLGYFRSAVVINTNERVVAVAGPAEGARIGEKLAPQGASAARALQLKLGSGQNGQLLLLSEASATSPGTRTGALLVAAWMTLTMALAAAGLFAWRLRRPGR